MTPGNACAAIIIIASRAMVKAREAGDAESYREFEAMLRLALGAESRLTRNDETHYEDRAE